MQLKKFSLAAGLLLSMSSQAQQTTIYSGTGFGTYYYDMKQVDVCGTSFASQNTGPVRCQTSDLSLDALNSNYVVAMNNTQLGEQLALYCGKKVAITSVNGQSVSMDLPLFIGDGCLRCSEGSAADYQTWDSNGAPGLDFSYSILDQLSGGNACQHGHFSITWEIVDEQLYDFDTNTGTTTTPASASAPAPTSVPTPPPAPAAPKAGGGEGEGGAAQVRPVTAPVQYQNFDKVAAAPTTLITTQPPATTTTTNPGTCSSGAWQCSPNGSVLEQCISGTWAPRATCAAGEVCRGGGVPYCAAPGVGQAAS
ncbi:hypothetical protein UA08_01089 [Talaromyces atroroseus]|uniref:CBM1 domain-containing protein n=1 Tax=Talaromyces atroroseus TaxID=1441469 RepID=A0A225AS08_TALAT|nr:hypothetical protein UA08_01089 [Talaromyces atroroseus]OKL64362.1 hypothetical protein UA08_01089 [Talaromyces atroroseus]